MCVLDCLRDVQDVGVLAAAFGLAQVRHERLLSSAAHAIAAAAGGRQVESKKRAVVARGLGGLPGVGSDLSWGHRDLAWGAKQVMEACKVLGVQSLQAALLSELAGRMEQGSTK